MKLQKFEVLDALDNSGMKIWAKNSKVHDDYTNRIVDQLENLLNRKLEEAKQEAIEEARLDDLPEWERELYGSELWDKIEESVSSYEARNEIQDAIVDLLKVRMTNVACDISFNHYEQDMCVDDAINLALKERGLKL